MLEAIRSDRKRNRRRSDHRGEHRSPRSHGKLKHVWFDFRHPCQRKSTLMVDYMPYMDFMAQQVSSGPLFVNDTQRDSPPFTGGR